MSIHDIIHTDSSVVTAWLSNHGVRLMLIALAVGALAAASSVWSDVNEAERESDMQMRIHQGLLWH